MQLGKIHKFVTKIRYKDLDTYSVLYHPRYFELADSARNQAFEDFGYPVEEQLRDKVGFTIAAIDGVVFKRPLFMAEEISIFTEVKEVSRKSCKVEHWICLGKEITPEVSKENAVFFATYSLVFVSIKDISDFPLNANNIKMMKASEFTDKVKSRLAFS